jgi:hypothetical protein
VPITISNAYIETFERNVRHLAQQSDTRLRQFVTEVNEQSEIHNWDRLAQSAAVQKTAARVATPVGGNAAGGAGSTDGLDWSRRRTLIRTFHTGELFEAEDPVQMLIDPQSSIVMNLAMNMKRQVDDIIIDAALKNATDGDGAAVPFPAGQKIGDGTTVITLDTVLEVEEKFLSNDVDPDERKCFVISPRQKRKLMQLMEVTSGDFQASKALATGRLPNWMGFDWIVSNRLTDITNPGTSIDCLAFTRKGLGLHVARDISSRVSERDDLSYAWQVYAVLTMDAVRTEDEHVVHIDLLNSV